MDLAEKALLFVHLLGFAALFGGAVFQLGSNNPVVNKAMIYSVLTTLLTEVLLVGVLEAKTDRDVDHAQVGVKFAVGVVVALLCWANRRRPSIPNGLYLGLLLLTVADVAVAAFW